MRKSGIRTGLISVAAVTAFAAITIIIYLLFFTCNSEGRMRVVLEVNTGKFLKKHAKDPDEVFYTVLTEAQKEAPLSSEPVVNIILQKFQERGLRLSRYFGTIGQNDDEILAGLKDDAENAVTRVMEIIRKRTDQYGVCDLAIQRQGHRRIIVEFSGVTNEGEAKQLLQGTALLEFRLVRDPDFIFPIMQKIDEILARNISQPDTSETVSEVTDASIVEGDTTIVAAEDSIPPEELTEEEFKQQHPFFAIALLDPQGRNADAYVKGDERNKLEFMLSRPEVQNVIPNNVEFVFSAKPLPRQEGQEIHRMYMVNKTPELIGGVITDAVATIDPNTSVPIVNMTMNSEGATEWARITGANVGKRIAIMLDGVVFSAPNVQNKIPGGRSQITGMADLNEAKLLEIVLKAGALPAPVAIIEERMIEP